MVDEQSIRDTITYLASDALKGRKPGTPEMELAAVYLEDWFSRNNVSPYFATYRDGILFEGAMTYNIVGCVEGSDPILKNDYVVIGAHYDHEGVIQVNDDADGIYNGANDNATGVAAVAEIAKYFAEKRTNKRSLLFCFFTLEEKDMGGSRHLAQIIKSKGTSLYTMLNFEMIGLPLPDGKVYLTGFNLSNMAEKLNGYARKTLFKKIQGKGNLTFHLSSDHTSFGGDCPAHTITTYDGTNFKFHHHVDDEIDKINIPHITEVINEMLPVIATMTNTADKEIKVKNVKNIIITGTSRGIGYELALQFANEGHNVLAVSRKIPKTLKEHPNITCLSADLAEDDGIESIRSFMESTWHHADIIIHNAGALVLKPFAEITAKEFEYIYKVNVFGVAALNRAVLPYMKKGGHVVTISSMGGVQGTVKFSGLSAYSSSKGAVITLSELLAEEYKGHGIAFNVLALGAVNTEMLQEAFPGYEAPLSSKEMADYIYNFALTGNNYFNGKVLQVSASTP